MHAYYYLRRSAALGYGSIFIRFFFALVRITICLLHVALGLKYFVTSR